MATDREVLQGFATIGEAFQKIKRTNAQRRANEQLGQLKGLEVEEQKEQFGKIAPMLAQDLAIAGRTPAEISQIIQQFKPKSYSSVAQADLMYNIENFGVEEGIERARKNIEDSSVRTAGRKTDKVTSARVERDSNKFGFRTPSAAFKAELKDGASLRQELDMIGRSQYNEHGESYVSRGYALGFVGDAKLQADILVDNEGLGNFYKLYKGLFNKYRKSITGAQASVQELNMLEKGYLNVWQSPKAFEKLRNQMKLLSIVGEWRKIKIEKDLGTDVRGMEYKELEAQQALEELENTYDFKTTMDVKAIGNSPYISIKSPKYSKQITGNNIDDKTGKKKKPIKKKKGSMNFIDDVE